MHDLLRPRQQDRIISDALQKQDLNGEKNPRSLILGPNIHWQVRASQCI